MGSYPSAPDNGDERLRGGARASFQEITQLIEEVNDLDAIDNWRADRDFVLRRLQMHASALQQFRDRFTAEGDDTAAARRDVYSHVVMARATAAENGVFEFEAIGAIPAQVSFDDLEQLVHQSLADILTARPPVSA